ncbi:substrate-binding domain-containing protein [Planktomarina temperata]|nr:substrate-binding domain-containing protein [Planktomarina temperata]
MDQRLGRYGFCHAPGTGLSACAQRKQHRTGRRLSNTWRNDRAKWPQKRPCAPRFAAFVTSSIIMANGIRRALDDRELKLGRDVSVITHDDDLSYFRDAAAVPVYTATRSSVREAGRLSADLLLKAIADPGRDPEGILLDAELILGSSTKPPRGR